MYPTTTTTTDCRARRTKKGLFDVVVCRSGRRCNADFLPPWNIDKFDDGCCWTEIFRFIFKLFCCVCEVFVAIGFLWLPLKRATHRLTRQQRERHFVHYCPGLYSRQSHYAAKGMVFCVIVNCCTSLPVILLSTILYFLRGNQNPGQI